MSVNATINPPQHYVGEVNCKPVFSPFDSILHLQGGASTYLAGVSVGEVESLLTEARRIGTELVYIQSDNRPANSIAVDPKAVTAIFAVVR